MFTKGDAPLNFFILCSKMMSMMARRATQTPRRPLKHSSTGTADDSSSVNKQCVINRYPMAYH